MQALGQVAAAQMQVASRSGTGSSPVSLVPKTKANGHLAFVAADGRALRITGNGSVDLNGKLQGPFAEFKVTSNEDSEAMFVQVVKTGLWLTIADGDFASAAKQEPLLPKPVAKRPSSLVVEAVEGSKEEKEMPKRLRTALSGASLPWPVRVHRLQGGRVLLQAERGNVACNANGVLHDRGGQGRWAQWEIQHLPDGIALRNVGHAKFLALGGGGMTTLADSPVPLQLNDLLGDLLPSPEELSQMNAAELSEEDRQHFREHGFVILRNAIPRERVRAALRLINFSLGQPDCWGSSDAGRKLKVGDAHEFQEVLRSPVLWSALNALLGTGHFGRAAQVALRFPQPPQRGDDRPDIAPGTKYHIDGMGEGKLCPFSILCGVSLSDQSRPNGGNLHVFPGSHLNRDLRECYRARIGAEDAGEDDISKPDLGESTQVLLNPGDVVLAHQLLAHRVGVNTSENIRYQLFFRVKHARHEELKEQVIDDPWVEFEV